MTSIVDQMRRASSLGLKHFVPEEPCIRGHFLRSTSCGRCIECDRLRAKHLYANMTPEQRRISNAKHLEWQRRNPEKQSRWVMTWHKKHQEQIKIIKKRYYNKKNQSKSSQ